MKALKLIQKISLVAVFIFAATTQTFAQIIFSEIVTRAANYKNQTLITPDK